MESAWNPVVDLVAETFQAAGIGWKEHAMRGVKAGTYVPEAYEGTIRWHDQTTDSRNTVRDDTAPAEGMDERIVLCIDHGQDEGAYAYLNIEQARELACILIIKADLLQSK
jgi:hypothetical protein